MARRRARTTPKAAPKPEPAPAPDGLAMLHEQVEHLTRIVTDPDYARTHTAALGGPGDAKPWVWLAGQIVAAETAHAIETAKLRAVVEQILRKTPRGEQGGVDSVSDTLQTWADVPERYRKLVERGKKGSRKASIRAHCLQCMGWSTQEVARCTASKCPLYRWRETG